MAGILAPLAQALGGCRDKRSPIAPLISNPPPRQPHCPESPELSNLRLSDGSLADIRIVKFLDTKLYFPAEWVDYYFFDKGPRFMGQPMKSKQAAFFPDIYTDECPGVVHQINADHEIPTMTVWILAGGKVPISHISAATQIPMLHFAANQKPQSQGLRAAGNGGFYDALVKPMPDILVFLSTRENYGRRTVESASIDELVRWLATPPAQRDNNKIFTLKVDAVARSQEI